jgi:CRP/FNR family nitrogen fixation transcriptional regulator
MLERAAYSRETPFTQFAGTVEAIAFRGLTVREYPYDHDVVIFGEGEPADYLYCVRRGAVRTFKTLRDGRRQIDAFHLPGEYIGLCGGKTYRSTAEAVVDSRVAFVKRSALELRAAREAEFACAMWKLATDELCSAQNHKLLLGRKNALERVVSFLLDMDRRLTIDGVMALPMSRLDIADYLGLTLETVSRSLSVLADEGVLKFNGSRYIRLNDRKHLRAMTL